MKKFLIVFLFIGTTASVFAQEPNEEFQTLFSTVDHHGGYGAFSVNYTEVKLTKGNIQDALVIGGRGLWIANHRFGLGMGGYGIITGSFTNEMYIQKVMLSTGYGGLIAEINFFPKKVLHLNVPLLVGAGGATLVESYVEHHNYNDNFANYTLDEAKFFIVEPGLEAEINIVKYLRISFGVYYRYTSGIDIIGVNKNAIDGLSGGVSLKVGSF